MVVVINRNYFLMAVLVQTMDSTSHWIITIHKIHVSIRGTKCVVNCINLALSIL